MTIPIMTPGGIYAPTESQLNWIKDDDVYSSLICIFDQDMAIVGQEVTVGNTINFDFAQLEADKPYYWQVFAGNKKAISPPIVFSVLSQDDYLFNLENAHDSHIYKKANDATQGLMDAVALEDANMLALAQSKYQSLYTTYPDNILIKVSYMAFCLRLGQSSMARAIGQDL